MTQPWDTTGKPFQRALAHWRRRQQQQQKPPEDKPAVPAFTIAISRQYGAGAGAVAGHIGARTGWPVYDRELVEKIAETSGLRTELLETVDERSTSWIQDCLEAFGQADTVSDMTYFRHLRQVLLSLSAHGECIIVGRGAVFCLPPETTLRALLVAPREVRIARVCREMNMDPQQAARHMEQINHARIEFVRDRYNKDLTDVHLYDLALNTGNLPAEACAEVVLAALEWLRTTGRGAGAETPAS